MLGLFSAIAIAAVTMSTTQLFLEGVSIGILAYCGNGVMKRSRKDDRN